MTMDENMGNGRILMGKSSTNKQFETMIDGENMGKFRDVPLPGDMPLGGFIKAVAARMTGQRSPSPSPKRCVDDFPRGAHGFPYFFYTLNLFLCRKMHKTYQELT